MAEEEEEEAAAAAAEEEAYRVKGSSRVSASMSPLPLKHNECMPMNALVVLEYKIIGHLEEGGGV